MGKLLERILLIGLGLIVLSTIVSGVYPFFNNIKVFDKFNDTEFYLDIDEFVNDVDEWVEEVISNKESKSEREIEKYFYAPFISELNISVGGKILEDHGEYYTMRFPESDILFEVVIKGERKEYELNFDGANFILRNYIGLNPKEYYLRIYASFFDVYFNNTYENPLVWVEIRDGKTVRREKEDINKGWHFLNQTMNVISDFFNYPDKSDKIYNASIIVPDNIKYVKFCGDHFVFDFLMNDELKKNGGRGEIFGQEFICLSFDFELSQPRKLNFSIYYYDNRLAVFYWETPEDFLYYVNYFIPWIVNQK